MRISIPVHGRGLLGIGLLLLVTFGERSGGDEPRRPNFLFILADDLGCRDLSGEGSTFYESPHMDRIAAGGMRFVQGYAACQVCSPSRASILTGKYPARHGITDWIGARSGQEWNRGDRVLPARYQHQLALDDTTLAEALLETGYRTFFAGKWHLGGPGSYPTDHGFEVNVGGYEAGSPKGGYFSPYKNPQLGDGPDGESLPLRLAEETVRFIESHQDEPFLAYLSFYSVHGPIQTQRELWNKYRRKASQHDPSTERFVVDRTLPVRQVQDNPIYAGMIETMDRAVGRVLDAVERLGLQQRTVVIFTSDNGGVSSGDAYSTSNLPFRGGKGRQWEGGIREPYYILAPGTTAPGSVCRTPVTGTDFYPTMLELAGLPLRPDQHVDGVSLVPLLRGKTISPRPLFWHYPHYGNQGGEPSSIIRDGPWKLIHYWEDGRDELYHLPSDVEERTDLAASKPQRTAHLRQQLDRHLQETGARIPARDTRFDPERALQKKARIQQQLKPRLEQDHARYLDEAWEPGPDWWGSRPARD